MAIDYGPLTDEIAWVGEEDGGANVKRILSRPGTIPVVLRFLDPIEPDEADDRKALAAQSRAEIVAALAGSEPARHPL